MFRILLLILFISGSLYSKEQRDFSTVYNLPNDTNKVISLLSLCTQYYDITHDTSLILAKEALTISQEIGYKRGEVESLFRIGNEYFFFNNQLIAINYFEKTISKAKPINARYWIARSYRQIASINVYQGRYKEALSLNKKALKIHTSMKDSSNQSQCYSRISLYYVHLNNFDSAFYYSQKSIDIDIKTKNKQSLGRSYRKLGNLHLANNNLFLSDFYYKKALSLQEIYGNKHEISHTYNKYGKLLIRQKKYTKAITFFKKAININTEIKLLKALPNLYKNLSYAEELAGLSKSSYKNYAKYITLNDSLQYKEDQIRLRKQQAELELLKLNKSALLLQQKKESQYTSNNNRKTLSIVLIVAIFILIFIIINSIKKQDLLNEITQKEKILTQQLIAKDIRNEQFNAINKITQNYEFAKEKIARELHDRLGGTLAAIKINLMQAKQNDELDKIIENLSKVATTNRLISHELHPPLLKSQPFNTIIQDYVKYIFNDTNILLSITLFPDDKINQLDSSIQLSLYRIIQEICSEIKEYSNAKNINFQLLCHKKEINLTIEEDGTNNLFNKFNKKESRINLTKERLKVMDGEMEVENNIQRGNYIYLFIPINRSLN